MKYKQQAITEFLNSLKIGVPIRPLIASPQGRTYRTVSKRKAFLVNRQFSLGLIGVDDDTLKNFPMTIGQCVIEPRVHAEVYRTMQEYLQKKEHLSLAEEFNYVVVKGNDTESAVIFNMNHFSSSNRKEINHLSKHLTHKVKNIAGIFVFVDEERSRYYLPGTPKKGNQTNFRPLTKIFGKEKLFHKVGNTKFLHAPLSFSQTNHSILEPFVTTAKTFLSLNKEDVLYDLYCGYGLFSLTLASDVRKVIGIELARTSINDAIDNVRINKITNAKFIPADITAETLRKYLKPETTNLKFLLDPPRSGTLPDVIEMIGEQKPEKVLHIFCNSDIIEKELKRWSKSGYAPAAVQPFDMFPGTTEIEVMILLQRAK
ncbi:MAG: class I SAM-dependent RNA methyltransferase [Ignavibacteriales bacterium]|nr:class I SAM-dependent RNA methyltransferase [Ignavibacteriales bacterium]